MGWYTPEIDGENLLALNSINLLLQFHTNLYSDYILQSVATRAGRVQSKNLADLISCVFIPYQEPLGGLNHAITQKNYHIRVPI